MPRAKQRTDELRAHVLVVALGMLEREGVLGFTARRIAEEAETSLPAVYELFGDKAGVIRELFFEGFRMLRRRFDELSPAETPRTALMGVLRAYRAFVRDHPVLAEVMFSQPFSDFNPGPGEQAAGSRVREFIVDQVRRCLAAGALVGDETDIAHVLLALAQGLAAQERAGWLGTSRASVERRWQLALDAVLNGLSGELSSMASQPKAPRRARTKARRALPKS